MPQIDWTPEFKRNTNVEFDRLKLKVGERARIVCLEKPSFTWVHTLRAPKIVNGEANKVIKRRKDGSEFADWDMDFIGRPQCLGDHSTIEVDSLDPKNCPICARAKESEETAAPERRFAMNVIKYNTKADGTLVTPFGCASQVWTFTEGYFNKLYDIAQEYGGLVGRDLILGPCQVPEAFQKFDISTGAKNVWDSDPAIKKVVVETHENNKLDAQKLEAACGRRSELRWLKEDIDKIAQRWKIAHGGPAAADQTGTDLGSLKGELDNLLTPPAAAPVEPVSDDVVPPAADADEPLRKSSGGSDPDDFSALLSSLKL